jgi:lysozyme
MTGEIKKLLSQHEGRIAHAYKDSLGYLTIGVGHLIDDRRGGKLPEHIIDALLEWDIAEHKRELDTALPWAKDLSEVRYAVLLDMAFNMGVPRLLGFVRTLAMVKEGRYKEAAENMLLSLWARQVKTRAVRLSRMMEEDKWPES